MNQDPENLDEQMKTLMAWRIPESKVKFWRDVWHLFLIFLGIGIGIGAIGFFQWWNCTGKNPDKTIMECLRYEIETKRIKK